MCLPRSVQLHVAIAVVCAGLTVWLAVGRETREPVPVEGYRLTPLAVRDYPTTPVTIVDRCLITIPSDGTETRHVCVAVDLACDNSGCTARYRFRNGWGSPWVFVATDDADLLGFERWLPVVVSSDEEWKTETMVSAPVCLAWQVPFVRILWPLSLTDNVMTVGGPVTCPRPAGGD